MGAGPELFFIRCSTKRMVNQAQKSKRPPGINTIATTLTNFNIVLMTQNHAHLVPVVGTRKHKQIHVVAYSRRNIQRLLSDTFVAAATETRKN
jgi:hypothetical protein